MLTACFDASGHSKQPVLVVAGFVSSAEDWTRFDKAWKARLSLDGLTYFQMHQFAQSCGLFKGWKEEEEKRRCLLSDLMGIILSNTYRKFGAAVINSDLNATIDGATRKEFALSAYGIAGRGAVGNVDEWLKKEKWGGPVDYVFESGDYNQADLSRRMVEDGFPDPIFRPKTDRTGRNGVTIPAFTPLQAADILAYEYSLTLKRDRDGTYRRRWPYDKLDKVPGEIGRFTLHDIRRIGSHFSSPRLLG